MKKQWQPVIWRNGEIIHNADYFNNYAEAKKFAIKKFRELDGTSYQIIQTSTLLNVL